MVKPNVKKGEAVHFLVRCFINAEMKRKQYLVYVHLHQHSGDVTYAKCNCPAGAGGCCKHVAATLYQLLDYIELGLSDIPDDKTCTQARSYKSGMYQERIQHKQPCFLRT